MTQAEIDAARAEAARREAEEAERRRQARIRELKGQLTTVNNSIDHYISVLKTLTDARTFMTMHYNTIYNDVMKASTWGYDLDGNLDWRGKNQLTANSVKLNDICPAIKTYDEDLKKLQKDIDDGVDKANAKIQSLHNQKNVIISELRSLGGL